jgi:uncharacterized protein with gpF-like domain
MLYRPSQPQSFADQLEQFSELIRDAFLAAIAAIRSRVTLRQLIAKLERHDTDGVIRALGVEGSAFNGMLDQVDAAFAAGGGGANRELPVIRDAEGVPISISFDARNPVAEAWLKQHGAALVRGIVDDQVTMLRDVISRDVGQGMGARQIALDLVGRVSAVTGQREGGLIGLTATQEQWATNFEAALRANDKASLTYNLRDRRFDRSIRAALNADKPLTSEQIDPMVRAFRNRALRYRGEMIGRTEALTALNAGRDEHMRQVVASGAVSGNLVDTQWRTILDGRERESHAAMDGQVVPFGQTFVSGLGNHLRYPGDPSAPAEDRINCRCSKRYVIRKAS